MRYHIYAIVIALVAWVAAARVDAGPRFSGTAAPISDEDRRAAPPTPELHEDEVDTEARDSEAVLRGLWTRVSAAHAAVARYVPGPVAWAILASPLWLLVVLRLVFRWWRRWRRRVRARRSARAREVAEAAATAAETASVSDEVDPTASPLPGDDLDFSPLERLLLAEDEQGAASLHETFVVLGADEVALQAFRRQLVEAFDPDSWAGLVGLGRPARLRTMRQQWIRDTATTRITGWLAQHSSVREAGLHVSTPTRLEPDELHNLTLTQPSGLAATLSREQREIVGRAREALSLTYEAEGDPYGVISAARQTGADELLGPAAGLDGSGSQLVALVLLLHGMSALARATAARLCPPDLGRELRDALEQHHRRVRRPVPNEGCAAHAAFHLQTSRVEGLGTLLAAAAGAAYSASSVVMRLSKLAGHMAGDRRGPLHELGTRVARLLDATDQGDGAVIKGNIARAFGAGLIQEHAVELEELWRAAQRISTREPMWGRDGAGGAGGRPDRALIQLHRRLLDQRRGQVDGACQQVWGVFKQLSFAGKLGVNQDIADRRLGYAAWAFGGELFRAASEELVEVLHTVGRVAAGGADTSPPRVAR